MARANLHPAWRDYRRRRWTAVGLFLGFIPSMILLMTDALAPLAGGATVYLVAILYTLAYLFAGTWFMMFKCPRCGAAFSPTRNGVVARKCINCGLPTWADPATGAPRGDPLDR